MKSGVKEVCGRWHCDVIKTEKFGLGVSRSGQNQERQIGGNKALKQENRGLRLFGSHGLHPPFPKRKHKASLDLDSGERAKMPGERKASIGGDIAQ